MSHQEGATHCERVRRRQAVGERRRQVARLDVHLRILDDPNLALAVEAEGRIVEGVDVRVAPKQTISSGSLRNEVCLGACALARALAVDQFDGVRQRLARHEPRMVLRPRDALAAALLLAPRAAPHVVVAEVAAALRVASLGAALLAVGAAPILLDVGPIELPIFSPSFTIEVKVLGRSTRGATSLVSIAAISLLGDGPSDLPVAEFLVAMERLEGRSDHHGLHRRCRRHARPQENSGDDGEAQEGNSADHRPTWSNSFTFLNGIVVADAGADELVGRAHDVLAAPRADPLHHGARLRVTRTTIATLEASRNGPFAARRHSTHCAGRDAHSAGGGQGGGRDARGKTGHHGRAGGGAGDGVLQRGDTLVAASAAATDDAGTDHNGARGAVAEQHGAATGAKRPPRGVHANGPSGRGRGRGRGPLGPRPAARDLACAKNT
mmetsp:Transcript_43375/g.139407  ORF Transcript_43375/g.139407 Transcript_43375/m.139407 type:complete len:438 (+) Transcript_43375:676-1989(+)